MKCPVKYFLVVLVLLVVRCCVCVPVGQPDAAVDVMSQVPQWHCMRYRKFELVRRCRSYKNGVRRNHRNGEVLEFS